MRDFQTEILRQIRRIAGTRLNSDLGEVSVETKASDVPGWDSLAHIDIVIALEDWYSVRFQTAELAMLNSIGDLVALIESKIVR